MEKEDNVVDKDMEKWQGEDKEERTAVGRGRTVWQEKRKKGRGGGRREGKNTN